MKSIIISIILFALFSGSFSSQACAECLKGDCENGKGIYSNSKYNYAGEFVDGKKHGEGVEYRASRIYNGSFKYGEYDGRGILFDPNKKMYIFGVFNGGELTDGTETLVKFENGIEAYYKVNTINKKSTMSLMKDKTADRFCNNNPTYIGCLTRAIENNKGAVVALLAVGYLASVTNSDGKSYSFNDVVNGFHTLADIMRKRQDQKADEWAEYLAHKIKLF